MEIGDVTTTTTELKRREQDEPENSTTTQTSVETTDTLTTIPPDISTETEIPVTEKIVTVPPEVKNETTTFSPPETSTPPPIEPSTEAPTTVPNKISMEPVIITTTNKPALPTTTAPTTIPTTIRTEMTTPFVQTTTYETTRFTYPPTEESTVFPVTEMMTSTSKSSMHLFTFKPITTTPIPEPISTTKRFYNPLTTDSSNAKLLNSLTTVPVPTAAKLNPAEISNARLLNPRNSRIYRFKRDPTSYNNFIPLTPIGYGVSSNVDFYDPYFSYATPNPSDAYYPDGNPIFATKDFEQSDHHHDEIDHIFYLNPQDSIRIGFKVYNTILRFAYIPSIQASALELPLDSENYSLLIIVPDQPIEDLVNVLGSHLSPSLANIRASLRNNWIKTMIPKFHLKGNVVLTGDLMKVCWVLLFQRYGYSDFISDGNS